MGVHEASVFCNVSVPWDILASSPHTIWHWHPQDRQIASRACFLMNPVSIIISVSTVPTGSCILNSLPLSFECSQFKDFCDTQMMFAIIDYWRRCHGSHHMRLRSRVLLDGVPSDSLVPVMEMVQVTTLCMNLSSKINMSLGSMPTDLGSWSRRWELIVL